MTTEFFDIATQPPKEGDHIVAYWWNPEKNVWTYKTGEVAKISTGSNGACYLAFQQTAAVDVLEFSYEQWCYVPEPEVPVAQKVKEVQAYFKQFKKPGESWSDEFLKGKL